MEGAACQLRGDVGNWGVLSIVIVVLILLLILAAIFLPFLFLLISGAFFVRGLRGWVFSDCGVGFWAS